MASIKSFTPRISISDLIKEGVINYGRNQTRKYKCALGPELMIKSALKDVGKGKLIISYRKFFQEDPLIKIIVSLKDEFSKYDSQKTKPYFICPLSGKRAGTLYLCNETHVFIHRDIYARKYPYELSKKFPLKDDAAIKQFKIDDQVWMNQRSQELNRQIAKWTQMNQNT